MNASPVWIGACYGQNSVQALNGTSGSRYSTLPKDKFDTDGTASLHNIVQGLTDELAKLKDANCDKAKKICVLSGLQGSAGK